MLFRLPLNGCSIVFYPTIRKTSLSIHGRFFWYVKVSRRITQGTSFANRVSSEKVARNVRRWLEKVAGKSCSINICEAEVPNLSGILEVAEGLSRASKLFLTK